MQYFSSIDRTAREKTDATPHEWLLIEYIRNAHRWAKPYLHDGRKFYWLAKSKITEDLPELRSPANVAKYLRSLTAKGLVELVVVAGQRAYYRVVDQFPPRRCQARPKLALGGLALGHIYPVLADHVPLQGHIGDHIGEGASESGNPGPAEPTCPPEHTASQESIPERPIENFRLYPRKFSQVTPEKFPINHCPEHIIDPLIIDTDIIHRAPARDEIPTADGEAFKLTDPVVTELAVKYPKIYIWDSLERMRKKYIARPGLRRPFADMRAAVEQWLSGDSSMGQGGTGYTYPVEVARSAPLRKTRDLTMREMLHDRSWAD